MTACTLPSAWPGEPRAYAEGTFGGYAASVRSGIRLRTWLDNPRRGATGRRRPPDFARPHAVAGVEELHAACGLHARP